MHVIPTHSDISDGLFCPALRADKERILKEDNARADVVTHSPWTYRPQPFNLPSREHMDILHRFGERVRQRRMALGLSQEVFADRCGLDRTYISGIERGRRNLSLRNIEVIARALGVTISQLTAGM